MIRQYIVSTGANQRLQCAGFPELRQPMSSTFTAQLTCFFLCLLLWMGPAKAEDAWILVDTEALTLDVFDGHDRLARFEGISIGRGGAGRDRSLGDQRTPLGKFRVAWLNPNSRFRFFIGLDYPSRPQVERAFRHGLINERDHRRFLRAFFNNRPPPQNTELGGHIGIHGLGRANPDLHKIANWTEGCVALTNEQIDRLKAHVRIGMPVIIR